jgi:hypothetical protein
MSGAIPLRARSSADPVSSEEIATALARAWTARSVRLATSGEPASGPGAMPARTIPLRSAPSTVRSPGWRAHPANPAPSYPKRTSQRVVGERTRRSL